MIRMLRRRPPPLQFVPTRMGVQGILQTSVRPISLAVQRILSVNKKRQTSSNTRIDLPIELLQYVFLLATEASCDDVDLAEKHLIQSTILACSQVCRLWRDAARGYSPLWIHAIDFQRQPIDTIRDILHLSGQHNIDVGHRARPFHVHFTKDLFVLSMLENHVSRIREWNVEYSSDRATQCWVFGAQTSSKLDTFRWKGAFSSSRNRLQPSESPFPNSNLQKLCLQDSNFPLSPQMNMTYLTELSVCNMESPRSTASDWVDILHRTPSLQFLSLHNAVAHGGRHFLPGTEPPVVLPYLRLISLGDDQRVLPITLLFLILKPSSFCGVQLSTPRSVPDVILLAAFAAQIIAFYVRDFLENIPCVELAVRPHSVKDRVRIGTDPNPETDLDWNGPGGTKHVTEYLSRAPASPFPSFNVGMQDPAGLLTVGLQLSSFLIDRATTLRITVDAPFAAVRRFPDLFKKSIPKLLAKARELTTLVLDEGAVLSVLTMAKDRFLQPGAEIQMGSFWDGRPKPLLPKLRFIIPQNVPLGPRQPASQILLDYMLWRRKVGFPVEVLNFGMGGGKPGESDQTKAFRRRGMIALALEDSGTG